MRPRAVNALREGASATEERHRGRLGYGSGSYDRAAAAAATKTEWANRVRGAARDNGDMELETGDRISDVDLGEGRVMMAVLGIGACRIAEVLVDGAGRRKLLIEVAPVEKVLGWRSSTDRG